MKPRYPQHGILISLLQKKQFEACRVTVEETIENLLAAPDLDEVASEQPLADAVKWVRQRDHELVALHIILCLALFNLNLFREAGEKADIAGFLARKVKDDELLGEALYRAGVCYGSNEDYPTATQRLTDCITLGNEAFLGDALYNRGTVYKSIGAYQQAIPEYEAAIAWALNRKPELVKWGRINLAWVLILSQEFSRAEEVLERLSQDADAGTDRTLQLQIAHDHAHMAFLRGQGRESLQQAYVCMQRAGREYPHVRARVALTLMGLALDQGMPQEAFTLGIVSKRLAGQAHRFDLDEEASRNLRDLEYREGTEALIEPLQRLRQVLKGSVTRRKAVRANNHVGGVG